MTIHPFSIDAAGTNDDEPLTPAFSPLYQQIKGLILQSLQSGEWKPSEGIPSEMDLAARYRVSQGTVRKAIDELAADHLLVFSDMDNEGMLIKGFDARGIVWYTNYHSRKGQELAGNPFAALQFHWVELERVVRIEGVVEKVSEAESDEYFHSRPLDSRLGAWASPQSEVISGRALLVANAARYGARYLLNPPRPPHWGGYRLQPDNWQFWQGRKSRLHDRLRYSLQNPSDKREALWIRERLAP